MYNTEEINKKISMIANENRSLMLETFNHIMKNPETGFREVKTSLYMQNAFENMGYDLKLADDIPGFYTVIDTGREGPEILILAELDALICREHPESDKDTGAVHNCGHNAQCAALLGVAAVLKNKDILDCLCGKIRLCAVPAEELIEIEYRESLRKMGVIKYLNGKTEFLHRGYFDGIDIAFMVHTTEHKEFRITDGNVGFVTKKVIYKGKSAHAGARPQNGINALYAAVQGLSAVNAIRETFKDEDIIRFHPIITEGGVASNIIPDKTVVDGSVRGKTFDVIFEANKRINRALCGGALSLGANISIHDQVGYSPLKNDNLLTEVAKDALKAVCPDRCLNIESRISAGSTDMGDLSCLIPVIHPYAPGAVGNPHGSDYFINNVETAVINSAMWQASIIIRLLSNNAEKANEIIKSYNPIFKTKSEFFEFYDSFNCDGDRIKYNDDSTAYIKLN